MKIEKKGNIMISYATFDPSKDYAPSKFVQSLCEKANLAWKAYADCEIVSVFNDVECMGTPSQVADYFKSLVTDEEKLDPNFEEIVDDIQLFVDENNAEMR